MRFGRRTLILCMTAVAFATAGCANQPVGGSTNPSTAAIEYPTKTVQLMAPAGAGGGWDTTARTMQKSLQEAGLLKGQSVEVRNVTGAAGTIGLAELVTSHKKNPYNS